MLAGDIGGTNARLALVRLEGGLARVVHDRTFLSDRYDGLIDVTREFLESVPADSAVAPVHACFAVAGPVRDGRVRATNLPWSLDEGALASGTGIPSVRLVNDFAAVGLGLDLLDPASRVNIKPGEADPDGAIVVMGPGTGFGHGILVGESGARQAMPSEGGHASLVPADAVEWEFVRELRRRHGHASWERLVSGPGMVSLYAFLAVRDPGRESADVREAMREEDPAAVITRMALAGEDDLSVETMARVTRALAAQAGNFALAVYATGGVYIAGGIAPRILPLLDRPEFRDAFTSKGRLSPLLERIPVHVVTDTRVGLLGAAAMAARVEALIGKGQE